MSLPIKAPPHTGQLGAMSFFSMSRSFYLCNSNGRRARIIQDIALKPAAEGDALGEDLKKLTITEEEEPKNLAPTKEEETIKVKLKTIDEVTVEVELSVAEQMETVQLFIEAGGVPDDVIPLPNVTSGNLSRIIEYCSEHSRSAAANAHELEKFDERFMAEMLPDEQRNLLVTANYLNVKNLIPLLSQSIADFLKNKSVEFMRNFLGVENDYTPEEEAQCRRENAWAFEGADSE